MTEPADAVSLRPVRLNFPGPGFVDSQVEVIPSSLCCRHDRPLKQAFEPWTGLTISSIRT